MIDNFLKNLNNIVKEFEEKLKSIRSHKLTLSWLENFDIMAYGKKHNIRSIATVNQLDYLKFKIIPWDSNIISDIEKGLRETNFGGSIQKEKDSLIVNFPPITEETKKNLLKNLNSLKEEFRIKIRVLRDEFLRNLKKQKDDKKISEDIFFKNKEKIDNEVEKINKKIEDLFKNKEKEILS
ncbi:MAG: ribosome-recycling factor [Candidatus Parcubacteria bacterium]|nr:MAG: ribosome-recycling factor [Candidatus Parcubacteria bacterium]